MPSSASNLRHTDVLELHVAHACNLTCESCAHYSNQGHRGVVSVDDADAWMGAWSGRLAPQKFKLLGGEPTIHPDLPAFVPLVRKHWPATTINIATNGFFLHKHPELPAVLAADGHAELSLSVHHASPEYAARLQPVLDLLSAWQKKHSFTMRINEFCRPLDPLLSRIRRFDAAVSRWKTGAKLANLRNPAFEAAFRGKTLEMPSAGVSQASEGEV